MKGVLDPKIDFGVSVSIIGQKIIVKNKNGKIHENQKTSLLSYYNNMNKDTLYI